MKKFYLLMLLFISTTVMGQTPIITMIMDGDCTGGAPKVVELYAQGTVDFSNFSLEKSSNGGAWGNAFDLSPLGTVTDEFVYIYKDDPSFATEFPNVTNNAFPTTSSAVDFNGDDAIRLINTGVGTVVDQYGADNTDGTGEPWEYQDGYAKRIDNTTFSGAWVEADWDFYNGSLDGNGLCQGGADSYETISNIGSFVIASGPTLSATPTTVSGFLQFVGTPSAEQTVDVSGMDLTADAVITVTSGDYEISSTSGSGFGASVTLPFGTGTIAPTTIYIRLNGGAVANPSNGELTITSAGATDVVVALEGEILPLTPSVIVSETTITGFSHFVGTPSAADSFMVEGFNLTDDITVSVPTNFEVSETLGGTYGASVTLTQSGSAVASTKIYVRLNGPAKNLNQVGDVTISSTGATDQTIALTGETLDYTAYSIGDVTSVDADGVADSVDVYVILTGVVHCGDFRGNGYDIVVIDGNNDGITLFNFDDLPNYTEPVEGDSLEIKGQIGQFNGLIQVIPNEITILAQGAATQTPTLVTTLDETTESQYVMFDTLYLVNGEALWPDHGNIDVTNGVDTFLVRVPGSSPMANTPTPVGPFSLTGLGKQYDSSSPYDSGYQLFPCAAVQLCNLGVTTTVSEATITADQTGVDYQWINCADSSIIAGETGMSFTATETGSYAVILTDGVCQDTSACVSITIDTSSLNDLDFAGVSVYPNPVKEVLNITNENGTLQSVEVVSATGSIVYSSTISSSNFTVNTAQLNAGVYFVNVRTKNSAKTFKVIK